MGRKTHYTHPMTPRTRRLARLKEQREKIKQYKLMLETQTYCLSISLAEKCEAINYLVRLARKAK